MTNGASTPRQQVTEWLSSLGDALAHGDIGSAMDLFDADCYWRDLLTFTWNLKTLEGKAEIKAMLEATLSGVCPAGCLSPCRPRSTIRARWRTGPRGPTWSQLEVFFDGPIGRRGP